MMLCIMEWFWCFTSMEQSNIGRFRFFWHQGMVKICWNGRLFRWAFTTDFRDACACLRYPGAAGDQTLRTRRHSRRQRSLLVTRKPPHPLQLRHGQLRLRGLQRRPAVLLPHWRHPQSDPKSGARSGRPSHCSGHRHRRRPPPCATGPSPGWPGTTSRTGLLTGYPTEPPGLLQQARHEAEPLSPGAAPRQLTAVSGRWVVLFLHECHAK